MRTLAETPAEEMRLRVSLHGGEVNDDEFGVFGTDLNTACRMVDAQPLRDVLTAATRSMVAVIVSDTWYRGVIGHGHEGIEASSYAPLLLAVKELRETAWLHVPGLSSPPDLPPYVAPNPAQDPTIVATRTATPASYGAPTAQPTYSTQIYGSDFRDIVNGSQTVHYGRPDTESGSR